MTFGAYFGICMQICTVLHEMLRDCCLRPQIKTDSKLFGNMMSPKGQYVKHFPNVLGIL